MSQAQNIICLTEEQIQITLKNLWMLRNLKMEKILYKGKPIFSKEIMEKYEYKHYTKFANNYIIYVCKSTEDNHKEIFITVETDHYDKQNILAISGFSHIIQDYINESVKYIRPYINICLCFVISQGMRSHIPIDVFNHVPMFSYIPVKFRYIQMCRLYPMIGSKTKIGGLTFNYRLIKKDENEIKAYNNKSFSIVDGGEPMAIALNALDGDLLVCDRIIYDATAYSDTQIKMVKDEIEDLSIIPMSGIIRQIDQSLLNVQLSQE